MFPINSDSIALVDKMKQMEESTRKKPQKSIRK